MSRRADFDGNGLTVTTFGASEFAAGLALQPDGTLVAAGGSNTAGDRDFALARYLSTNEQPPLPPTCGGVSATTLGTARDDTLRTTRLADVIMGLRGDDTIRGLGGDDILCGGPGNDEIVGGDGNDRILGERGSDRIFGDLGALPAGGQDNLFGGSGDDLLMGVRETIVCIVPAVMIRSLVIEVGTGSVEEMAMTAVMAAEDGTRSTPVKTATLPRLMIHLQTHPKRPPTHVRRQPMRRPTAA